MSERRVKASDGTVYVVTYDDKSGEQTGITKTGGSTPAGAAGDVGWGLKPTTGADTFRENFAAPIRSGLVTGGRVAGGAIAAPTGNPLLIGGGSVLGGMAGDQAYQVLQSVFPRLFGARETTNPLESTTESGVNTLLDYGVDRLAAPLSSGIGKGLTRSGRDELKNNILQKFFRVNPTIPVQETLSVAPDFDVDLAQATQNSRARVVRDILFRQEALNEFATQQPKLAQEANEMLTGIAGKPTTIATTPRTVAVRATVSAEGEKLALRAEERSAYNYAEKNVIPKVKTTAITTKEVPQDTTLLDSRGNQVLPSTKMVNEAVEITGPVYVNNTLEKASEIVTDIDKVLTDKTNMLTTDPEALTALQKLKDKLSVFINVPVDPKNSKPVISYESAKANKQVLNDFLETAPEMVKQRYVKSVQVMRDLLSKDIHETANTEWPVEARDALNAAYNKTKAMAARFDPQLARNLTSNDPDVIKESMLNQALSNVQMARQFKAAVGSRDELGTEYTRRLLQSAQDEKGFFNGKKALDQYYATYDIAQESLSAQDRKGFEYLMKRMQAVDPKLGESGHVAFAIRHGGAILGLSVGAIRGVSSLVESGDPGAAFKTGATAGALTGGAFIGTVALSRPMLRKLFFDPKNARIAAQLVSIPPQSSQAQLLMRGLLRTAFKGAQIQTQYGPYIVAPDGKLDPVKP